MNAPTGTGRVHQSTRAAATDGPRATRGTSNRDLRGNTKNRRARRRRTVARYLADAPLIASWFSDGTIHVTGVPWASSPHGPTDDDIRTWCESLWRVDQARAAHVVDGPKLVHVAVLPAARCYRCGKLLHAGLESPGVGLPTLEGTVTNDRIDPGGSYRDTNIRPACGPCQEHTGGKLGAERAKASRRPRGDAS